MSIEPGISRDRGFVPSPSPLFPTTTISAPDLLSRAKVATVIFPSSLTFSTSPAFTRTQSAPDSRPVVILSFCSSHPPSSAFIQTLFFFRASTPVYFFFFNPIFSLFSFYFRVLAFQNLFSFQLFQGFFYRSSVVHNFADSSGQPDRILMLKNISSDCSPSGSGFHCSVNHFQEVHVS